MTSLVNLASNPTKALNWIRAQLASLMPISTIEWEMSRILKQAQQLIKEGNIEDLKEIDKRFKHLQLQNLLD